MEFSRARKRVGLTQIKLAEAVGAGIGTVAGWETGDHKPSAKFIPLLADVLNLSADEVLNLEPTKKEEEV